ncbi:MAG: OmpA family protein [Candidatus Helarchaeota archaeon]
MRKRNSNNVEGFWFSYIDAIAIFASIFIIYFSVTYLKNIKSIQFSNKREEAFRELEKLGAKPKPSIEEGGWIITVADSILFPHNSIEVTLIGKEYLNNICNKLKLFTIDDDIRKTIKVIVGGHADTTGQEIYNLFISDFRANNVAAIIQNNIEDINISTIPYGEKRAEHSLNRENRRTTITIQVIAVEHIKDDSTSYQKYKTISNKEFKRITRKFVGPPHQLSKKNILIESIELETINIDSIRKFPSKKNMKPIETF